MDTSLSPTMVLRTLNNKETKLSSHAKEKIRSMPSRNRKRYDPQRRLEVAETRRKGACTRCREKRVRCSPAQHKSFAGERLESSTSTTLSSSSRSTRSHEYISTGEGNVVKTTNIMGIENCVQAAKAYIKVAQTQVEEFARFVKTWELAQRHAAESKSPTENANIATPNNPPRAHEWFSFDGVENVESLSHADHTAAINKYLSAVGMSTYIENDQTPFSSISLNLTKTDSTVLSSKEGNRLLLPKPLFVVETSSQPEQASRRPPKRNSHPKLKLENEPWIAFAADEHSNHPQRKSTSMSANSQHQSKTSSTILRRKLPCSSGFSEFDSIESRNTLNSTENSNDLDLAPRIAELDVFDSTFDSTFDLGFDFSREIIQVSDDPFLFPSMVDRPQNSAPNLSQDHLEFYPSFLGPTLTSHINNGSFDTSFQTLSYSIDVANSISAPGRCVSREEHIATAQESACEPSTTASGQWQEPDTFVGHGDVDFGEDWYYGAWYS